MKSTRRGALAVILSAVCAGTAAAATARHVNSFLETGLGGRAFGLGGSFVALADDASAVYWNPGGLSQVRQIQAEALYRRRFENILQDQGVVFSVPSGKTTWGVGYLQTQARDIPVTRALTPEERNLIQIGSLPPPSPDRLAKSMDSALLIGVSRPLGRHVSLGVTGKLIHRNFLGDLTAAGYGVDAGLLFRAGPLSVGANVQDAAQDLTWKGKGDAAVRYREKAPVNLRVASALSFAVAPGGYRLALLAGGRHAAGSAFLPEAGAEVQFPPMSVRGSMVLASSKAQDGFRSSLAYQPSLGLGLALKAMDLQYGMRYHPLGWVQTVSLGWRWGKPDAR